jgi:outer membrane protein OmpA-like peptidoglycan-associated protein
MPSFRLTPIAVAAALWTWPLHGQTVVEFGPDGELIYSPLVLAPVSVFVPELTHAPRLFPIEPLKEKIFVPVAPDEQIFAGPAPADIVHRGAPTLLRVTPFPKPPAPVLDVVPVVEPKLVVPPEPPPAPPPLETILMHGPVNFPAITFETGSATLKDEAYRHIEGIAAALNRSLALRVTIVGHTDDVGSHADNQDLSERRAAAVRAALVVRYGIGEARLATDGRGETEPFMANTSAEGRALNRRVELRQTD